MSKLEQQLRMSLIQAHTLKAADFAARAQIAINPSLSIVLMEHAQEHLDDAQRLVDEMTEQGAT